MCAAHYSNYCKLEFAMYNLWKVYLWPIVVAAIQNLTLSSTCTGPHLPRVVVESCSKCDTDVAIYRVPTVNWFGNCTGYKCELLVATD